MKKRIQEIISHKYKVFRECLKYGLIWQGLIHDLSKFYPSELLASDNTYKDFLHFKKNKHHWQWWLNPNLNRFPLPIPERYQKEMLADIKAKGINPIEWLSSLDTTAKLNPITREELENLIFSEIDLSEIRRAIVKKT